MDSRCTSHLGCLSVPMGDEKTTEEEIVMMDRRLKIVFERKTQIGPIEIRTTIYKIFEDLYIVQTEIIREDVIPPEIPYHQSFESYFAAVRYAIQSHGFAVDIVRFKLEEEEKNIREA